MNKFLELFIKFLNWLPEFMAKRICNFLGACLYYGFCSRRRIILKNLHIVFHDKSAKWCRRLALLNCCRWVETAWAFLATSTWSKGKIQQNITINPVLKDWIEDIKKNPRSAVVLVPHLNLMETMTWIPCFFKDFPESGVVYRHFRAKWLECFVKTSRERFGLQLISRKRGIMPLEKILKNNGIVSILFDQSAGETGCLTTFFGRLASSTDLPGRLVEKYKSDTVAIYLKRTGFLKGEICIEEISSDKTANGLTFESGRWLEGKLKEDACFYENWLWMHRRWKTQCSPLRRFNIAQKRNLLEDTCAYFHWEKLPKKTHVWFRMPNWLGDCVMAYPVLKAVRSARPDFCIHLVVKRSMASWLQRHFDVDFIHVLPEKSGLSYFKSFWNIRKEFPDVWVNFTNSIRSDLEAFCSGAEQRFGLQKQGLRLLLTHVFKTKPLPGEHQTELWYRFLQNYGLKAALSHDNMVECKKDLKTIKSFGIFCGSANTPKKRWSPEKWQKLIGALLENFPAANCVLLGGHKDQYLCTQVLMGLPTNRITNLTGQTSLLQLENILSSLDFVVGNDSGGMHLSNSLGIPTVGLFGPTDPAWGGPFYDSPKCIIKSPTNSMQDLSVHQVKETIEDWIESSKK